MKRSETKLRQRINDELAGYGQRLWGRRILQDFDDSPLRLPLRKPWIVGSCHDLGALAQSLGVR